MLPVARLFANAVASLTVCLAATPSHAMVLDLAGFGTQVSASTAGNCPSFCTGNQFATSQDGGSAVAAAATAESTYGTARGSAAFAEGNSYLPVLKAYGSSAVGRRAGVSSFASQQFSYSGAARTVDLKIDLTGTLVSSLSGYASNSINANIAIVMAESIPWFPSFSTLIFEAIPQGVVAIGNVSITDPALSFATSTLSFSLNPGDSFFVVAQLDVNAQNGIANAENTLVMSFDAATAASGGLQAALTAVPELGTAWLAGLGLLALALVGRRRARQA